MLVIVVITPIHGWFRMENIRKFPKNGLITGGAPKMETSMGGWEDQGKPTRKDLKTWGKHLVSSKPGDRKKMILLLKLIRKKQ
jgi:hypothetical protein